MIRCVFRQFSLLLIAIVFFSCSPTNNKPLLIGFSADSSDIVIRHVDEAGLLLLRDKSVTDSTLHALVSVLQTPSEKYPEIKELPVEGRIAVTDSGLTFTPVNPLIGGRDYLIITHLNAKFAHISDLLKGPLANRIQPQQKILTR